MIFTDWFFLLLTLISIALTIYIGDMTETSRLVRRENTIISGHIRAILHNVKS